MKNILIVFTGSMDLGGIERSLLGLLDSFDYYKVNVDLFLYSHHGELFSLINKNVNILPEVKELAYLRESLSTKLRHGCYYSSFLRVSDCIKDKLGIKYSFNESWAKVMRKFSPELEEKYDLAIGFFLPF